MNLYKLVACLIPYGKWRRKFRNFLKDWISVRKSQKNYRRQLYRIQGCSRAKVIFLVWENCKWSYDTLYLKLRANQNFDPIICLIDSPAPDYDLNKNKSFFDQKGYSYQVIKTLKDLKRLKPSIVFYEQPWPVLNTSFFPTYVSKYAICLYVPYSIELNIHDVILNEIKLFYLTVYKIFVFNAVVQDKMLKKHIPNTICSGHPRLDAYVWEKAPEFPWKSENKMRIIYAPHHSFEKSLLKWATYEWSGEHILQLAKTHADTTEWVFKPHPLFRLSLAKKFGQDYADEVFAGWAQVSSLYDQGDYYDLFKTADLMISDCGSFKIEWLPTGKPYLNLVSQYPDAEPDGPLKEHLSSGYYHAHTLKELDAYFHQLVDLKQDPLKSKRESLIKEIPLNASDYIFNYLMTLLKPKTGSYNS